MSKIYDKDGKPSLIVTKAGTLDSTGIVPQQSSKGSEKRDFIINEVVKSTDNELVIPYYVVKDNEKYAYANATGWGAGTYSYSYSQNWVNRYETIKFFNDEHYWADILPERRWNWKSYERQNNEGTNGGCGITASNDKFIWPIFADYNSTPPQYWSTNIIRTTNNLSGRVVINSNCVVLGITSKTSQNVQMGFEAVISGAGLDDYVTKMNEEYTKAANKVPRVCRLFSVRVKGGVDRSEICGNSTSTSNCIVKFLSFDPNITPAKMEYKKVGTNTYYIRDDNLYTMKFNSSNGLFYIERVSTMGTRTYYLGNPSQKWVLNLNDALKWNTAAGAEAFLEEARSGEAKPSSVNVAGDYQTCVSPLYFYNKFSECSFEPYHTNAGSYVYNAVAIFGVKRQGGGVDTSSFYYTGPTANNEYDETKWELTTQCPLENRSIFITPDELNGFLTYLSGHPDSPYGTLTGTNSNADGSYTTAGYNFDNTQNMFINMPEVKTLAFAYHFKPA
jgi:hypothetical protein